MSPCELNRNTLNARCNLISPSGPTRWQSRFVDWPSVRSNSSTSIQFSSNAISCKFFVSNLVADTRCRDGWHALFTKCANVRLSRLFVIMLLSIEWPHQQCNHNTKRTQTMGTSQRFKIVIISNNDNLPTNSLIESHFY